MERQLCKLQKTLLDQQVLLPFDSAMFILQSVTMGLIDCRKDVWDPLT